MNLTTISFTLFAGESVPDVYEVNQGNQNDSALQGKLLDITGYLSNSIRGPVDLTSL